MKFLLSVMVVGLFLFVIPCAVSAQEMSGDRTVEAEGEGPSRQAALLAAKRNAVEQGIGLALRSETEVKNFILQKDRVVSHCEGAVKNYILLKEEQQDGGWQVRIRAVVSMSSISSDLMALKILLASMDKPRIMVLIHEEGGQNSQNRVVDYLQGKGFDLVDAAQAAALMNADPSLVTRAMNGDATAVAGLGKEQGAEYMIVGQVRKNLLTGNSLISDSGLQSGQARLTARVINSSNARIIASKSATGAAIHVSADVAQAQAAAKAAEALMDQQLFETILGSFQDTVNNGATFEVTIAGVKNYQMQKKVGAVFKQCEGVVSVNKRYFKSQKLGLTVVYQGSADSLCDRIDGKAAGGASLMVTEVMGNRIVIEVQE